MKTANPSWKDIRDKHLKNALKEFKEISAQTAENLQQEILKKIPDAVFTKIHFTGRSSEFPSFKVSKPGQKQIIEISLGSGVFFVGKDVGKTKKVKTWVPCLSKRSTITALQNEFR